MKYLDPLDLPPQLSHAQKPIFVPFDAFVCRTLVPSVYDGDHALVAKDHLRVFQDVLGTLVHIIQIV